MPIHTPENAFITVQSNGLQLLQIPARKDNYYYLLHCEQTRQTAAIDPGDADPILWALEKWGWSLTHIFNTHHHGDHVSGNNKLVEATGAQVFGYREDAARIPGITRTLVDGEKFIWGNVEINVIFVPGHTTGHIAYHMPEPNWLFCGDALFLMGCGRLFEGTPAQAYHSLHKLAALPDENLIFCAHEYTENNGEFALTVDPQNAALQQRIKEVKQLRQEGTPTVPATLATEKATNPFLRAESVEEFAELRKQRDKW